MTDASGTCAFKQECDVSEEQFLELLICGLEILILEFSHPKPRFDHVACRSGRLPMNFNHLGLFNVPAKDMVS